MTQSRFGLAGHALRMTVVGPILVALAILATGLSRDVAIGDENVAPTHSLQLLSPGPTSIATINQLVRPSVYTAAISDDAIGIKAGPVTFRGSAPGMHNVSIVTGGRWTNVQPDRTGRFETQVDFSGAPRGPTVVDVYAWDALPDVPRYTVALNLRVVLVVEDGRDGTPPVNRPPGHPAHGRQLVWSDDFATLSLDRWQTGPKPDGQEFGLAVLAGAKDPRFDPYLVRDGFLRIRSQHVPDLVDPNGWGRTWITGQLSTGFPDGHASGAFRTGYFEARMLLPAGPGAWPSFWLLDQNGITRAAEDGAVEVDIMEGYGHSTTSYVATLHDWPPTGTTPVPKPAQRNITGLPSYDWAFHDFGCELTEKDAIFYFDGVERFRAPLPHAATLSPFFMLMTMAMSHDWPISVPPSGSYDLWIDYVRVYR